MVELRGELGALWEESKEEFYSDGSLLDICATELESFDWEKIFRFIKNQDYPLFDGEGGREVIENVREGLFTNPDAEAKLLAIDIGGIFLHCHFFSRSEVEFDLVPTEIGSPARLGALSSFMIGLADVLQREVVLTPEGTPEKVILRAGPGMSIVEYVA